jgi:hypothetical protein
VAILAALIGVGIAICLRRTDRVQRLAIVYAFVCLGVGIVLWVLWFCRTDWMMQHVQGPPILLFSAMASLVLGIGATLAACGLGVARRAANTSGKATMRGCMCWASLLILTLLSVLFSWYGLGWVPRALRKVQRGHFEALEHWGAAAIPALVAGLRDEDHYIQTRACSLLGKLGPRAGEAVPALIKYLEPCMAGQEVPSEAVWALGKIGPAAAPAIPLLVRLAEHEESSWFVRRAVVEALQGIGTPASRDLVRVIEFSQALATRQLPRQLSALQSTDPEVVRSAANFLFSMGGEAQAALPALENRLAEIRQNSAKYDYRWKSPEGSIKMAILGITQGSVKRQR